MLGRPEGSDPHEDFTPSGGVMLLAAAVCQHSCLLSVIDLLLVSPDCSRCVRPITPKILCCFLGQLGLRRDIVLSLYRTASLASLAVSPGILNLISENTTVYVFGRQLCTVCVYSKCITLPLHWRNI